MTKGHYYPAIDGLRTVAVLAVIFFHGAKFIAPGGFLGVDVFFVISGFVITLTLLREYERTGRIALWPFYVRRFWRLTPALVLALILAAVVAAIWRVEGLRSFLFQAFTGITYTYNVAQVVTDNRGGGLLSHLWSLAVEEQFYLVWAPLLALGLGVFAARKARLRAVLVAIIVVFGLRVATFLLLGELAAFFLPWARFDQFLIGAGIAILMHHSKDRMPSWFGSPWPSLVALVVLVVGFATVPDLTQPWLFFGGYTVSALLAALIIVHGYTERPTFVNRGLGAKPMVWVGKRSYGVYLYHYPVEHALRAMDVPEALHPFLTFGIALLLAAGSYRWVETPLRQRGTRSRSVRPCWRRRRRSGRRCASY